MRPVSCAERTVVCAATPCDLREEAVEAKPQSAPPELSIKLHDPTMYRKSTCL